MIRILILDDSTKKIEDIKTALTHHCEVEDSDIQIAKSVSEGKKCVKNEYYDIVLVDLVLPMYDDDDPKDNGGLNFIRNIISAGDSVRMPCQILGLTEYEDAFEKEKEEFSSFCFSIIQYKQGDNEWISKIVSLVNLTIRNKKALLKKIRTHNEYDVGVICALPEEYQQLLAAFGGKDKWREVRPDEDVPFLFKTISITTVSNNVVRVITASADRVGSIPTAVLTTLMYVLFHVKTVFMTGFSAGLSCGTLKLGDILIAQSIQDYANGKLTDLDGSINLLKEIHQIEAPTSIIQKFQDLLNDFETQSYLTCQIKKNNLDVDSDDTHSIRMAATCCGPFIIASEETVKDLKKSDRKLEGLDIEGYGLYLTSKILTNKEQKGALWIKGVSDYADSSKSDKYHKVCAFASAVLLYHYIKEKM